MVELRQGETTDGRTLIDGLRGRIADWWLPDEIVSLMVGAEAVHEMGVIPRALNSQEAV